MQEKAVYKFVTFDERTKRKAMKVVCDFPGVTVIDVKEKGKLKVTGEFDNYDMTKKLKNIGEVDMISVGPDGEPVQNRNPVNKPEPKTRRPTISNPRRKIGPTKNSDDCIIL